MRVVLSLLSLDERSKSHPHLFCFSFRDVSWRCTMTITTLTLKGHHSGGGRVLLHSRNDFLPVYVSVARNANSLLCLRLQCRSGSLQRSWKVLLPRKCVSWSWYVTRNFAIYSINKSLNTVRRMSLWPACFEDLIGSLFPGRHCWSVTDLCFSGLRDLEQPDVALADEW